MCRITEEEEKKSKREGGCEGLSSVLQVVSARFCRRCRQIGRLPSWSSGDSPPWILPFSAFFLGSFAELDPDAPHQRKYLCKLLSCRDRQRAQTTGDEISAAETSKLT